MTISCPPRPHPAVRGMNDIGCLGESASNRQCNNTHRGGVVRAPRLIGIVFKPHRTSSLRERRPALLDADLPTSAVRPMHLGFQQTRVHVCAISTGTNWYQLAPHHAVSSQTRRPAVEPVRHRCASSRRHSTVVLGHLRPSIYSSSLCSYANFTSVLRIA